MDPKRNQHHLNADLVNEVNRSKHEAAAARRQQLGSHQEQSNNLVQRRLFVFLSNLIMHNSIGKASLRGGVASQKLLPAAHQPRRGAITKVIPRPKVEDPAPLNPHSFDISDLPQPEKNQLGMLMVQTDISL